MSLNPCSCEAGKQNTQASRCKNLEQIARRLIIVPEFKNDGSKFDFANVAAITETNIIAAINAVNPNDRIYPLGKMEQVEEMRGDSMVQEFNSGNIAKIDDGKREFTAFIPLASPILEGKIKSWACHKFGVYIIDKMGNFVYNTDKETGLRVQPILIDENSLDVTYVTAKDNEVSGVMIKFKFRASVVDRLRRYIESSSLDFDALEDIYSLYDVSSSYSSISTTGFTATLKDEYGLPVEGLVISEFSLYNTTTSLAVVVTGLTETSRGVYALTFAAQGSGNSLRLTPSKNGYDFSAVVSNLITIP